MSDGAAVKFETFDDSWPVFRDQAIKRIINYLELEERPNDDHLFTSEEYMRFYSIVYNTCCDKHRKGEGRVYDQYKKTIEYHITSKVLPSLRGKDNEALLRELLRRWNNHKIMEKWLSRFFGYLSRYFINRTNLPSLAEASNSIFYNMVCCEFKDQVTDVIATLIDREREGGEIDSAMVKEVMDIYEELGGEIVLKHSEGAIEEAIGEFEKRCSV